MSGGVDSAVAAHVLKLEGHEVFGLTADIGTAEFTGERNGSSRSPVRAARRAAEELAIPLHVVDAREPFRSHVLDYFLREYASGRTPNPCVVCNAFVKFGCLVREAESLGARFLATGHHAVVEKSESGTDFCLRSGADHAKDQSYFLYALAQPVLSRVLTPVGRMTKAEVRALAREAGLSAAEREESQDVCFAPRGDLGVLFARALPEAVQPGPIEDLDGRVLGRHGGIARYTVGQRSGLGLSRPRPTYVVDIDAVRNVVIVGNDEDLFSSELEASHVNWIAGPPPTGNFRCEAKVRYAAAPRSCAVTASGDVIRVMFDAPQRAIAPGQSVVLYDGDIVLGGGRIKRRKAGRET
jgi:tRNA-uridine 2-sulfurtransferase